MGFEVTRQVHLFDRNRADAFHVSDPLLYDCIGLGTAWQKGGVGGFNRGKEFGYALLSYFTACALNVHRLPFCQDRIVSDYSRLDDYRTVLEQLTEHRVATICEEVRALYKHTQDKLAAIGRETVFLRREIKKSSYRRESGYAETIVRLCQSAKLLGQTQIQVEMDALNSFGDEGLYCGDVTLELEVPVKDVLYCSLLVGNRPGKMDTMESGEWVVINRSPTGVVDLPVSAISFRADMWCEERSFSLEEAKQVLQKYSPIVIRHQVRSDRTYGTQWIRPTLKQKLASWLLSKMCNCPY